MTTGGVFCISENFTIFPKTGGPGEGGGGSVILKNVLERV